MSEYTSVQACMAPACSVLSKSCMNTQTGIHAPAADDVIVVVYVLMSGSCVAVQQGSRN